MELLRELITEDTDVIPLTEALNESIRQFNATKRGGLVKNVKQGAGKFFRANPGLVIGAATLAIGAYSKYKKSKRNTIKLFARDPYEKKMMSDISDMLVKSGKFKLRRTKYADNGKYWEFRRIGV